jgi:K+-sensing histidine kinase KdpD
MLVSAMRGTLSLENREEGGARAVFSLPAAGEQLVSLHRRSPDDAEAAE